MGGAFSTDNKSEEKRLRDYEQDVDNQNNDLLDPKKNIKFYHYLLYEMNFRIFYATLLALFLGFGLTLILFLQVFEIKEQIVYGSCLIKNEFRFQCLINGVEPPNESKCIDSLCCYENNDELPYKCFHSFTPAFQYKINRLNSGDEKIFSMALSPKWDSSQRKLGADLVWTHSQHLSLNIFDSSNSLSETNLQNEIDEIRAEAKNETDYFEIDYGQKVGELFYLNIKRKNTSETIFDTRVGPLTSDGNSMSFATVLPSKYFYGLKGGGGDGYMSYESINSAKVLEMPFYLAFEKSGLCHGVYIETSAPSIVQYVEAPALYFHLEKNDGSLKINFFPGPTQKDVYRQVNEYLNKTEELPPYWSLGLHLCRKYHDEKMVLKEIKNLAGEDEDQNMVKISIPYDSDCIDEYLRSPFGLYEKNFTFSSQEFQDIMGNFSETNKTILLTQSISVDYSTYKDISISNSSLFILDESLKPLIGSYKNISVLYPNYFNNKTQEWAYNEMEPFLAEFPIFETGGMSFVSNFPLNELKNSRCEDIGSRIRKKFEDSSLICPSSQLQNNGNLEEYIKFHNHFGERSSRVLAENYEKILANEKKRVIYTSDSVWVGSNIGFNGINVPFTWAGLSESLFHLLRNYMLVGTLSGSPICGSYLEEVKQGADIITENKDQLCLRWFQLGLYLPFAKNTYTNGSATGPKGLSRTFQNYVKNNIITRYKFAPYFYSQIYENILNKAPLLRPLSYDFGGEKDFENTMGILSQFMIGNALMVVPILSEASGREAYFPTGTWYDLTGNRVMSDLQSGKFLNIQSIFNEIPVFIRGGSIIPTIESSDEVNSILESRYGNYTIIVTFPNKNDPDSTFSTGLLFVDDGESKNKELNEEYFDIVTFTATPQNITIDSKCGEWREEVNPISSTIGEIKIFGFEELEKVVEINLITPNDKRKLNFSTLADEESKILRILNLNLDYNCSTAHIIWTFEPKLEEDENEI